MAPFKDGPGFWALDGLRRDPRRFQGQRNVVVADEWGDVSMLRLPGQVAPVMIFMDPPQHTALRKLVNKGFTPRQVARLNEHIAEMARQIVDDVIERGECEFVDDVAGALPSYVIAEMLGIPIEDGRRLYQLTETLHTGSVGDSSSEQAMVEMFQYGTELAARKRADPGDDIAHFLTSRRS